MVLGRRVNVWILKESGSRNVQPYKPFFKISIIPMRNYITAGRSNITSTILLKFFISEILNPHLGFATQPKTRLSPLSLYIPDELILFC